MQNTGIIFNIQRFCIHDGPGIRTTVFLKGCPLNCAWCHNPESKTKAIQLSVSDNLCAHCGTCTYRCTQNVHHVQAKEHSVHFSACIACGECVKTCTTHALEMIGAKVTVQAVMEEVLKDSAYYATSGGGMTLSGGEPLMQPQFSLALLQEAKQAGLHTCVETCGFCHESVLRSAVQYVDLFYYDFKCYDEQLHKQYVGVSLLPILNNLSVLERAKANVVLRCPIIPGINDVTAHFQAIASLSKMSCISQVELMPYHSMGKEKAKKIGTSYPLMMQSTTQEAGKQWYDILRHHGCTKIKQTP